MKARIYYRIILTPMLLSLAMLASAVDEPTTGLEVAQERKARDTGWKDYAADITMVLRNAHGEESQRALSVKVLEVEGEGDKSINVFSHPHDVKGTALLSISHIHRNDDQWLYLPALRRTKRIASANQSGPFMGSEFSYEDLTSFEVEKYTYTLLGTEACPDTSLSCYQVEARPTYDNSGYQKLIVWIDATHFRPQKTVFYDQRGNLLKTLLYKEYEQYLDEFWRPHRLEMTNHQTEKSTDLLTKNIAFGQGLSDSDFRSDVLKRLR